MLKNYREREKLLYVVYRKGEYSVQYLLWTKINNHVQYLVCEKVNILQRKRDGSRERKKET